MPVTSLRPAPLGERHYTVDEISELWNLGGNTVRKLFKDEPGVLKLGEASRLLGGRKKEYKRRYFVLRIPETVLKRVQDRLMNKRPAGSAGSAAVRLERSGGDLHAS